MLKKSLCVITKSGRMMEYFKTFELLLKWFSDGSNKMFLHEEMKDHNKKKNVDMNLVTDAFSPHAFVRLH